jgi:PD-(D/E)XK nuclease superfamily
MTEKACLYVNPKGYKVTRHSYSGSDSFSFCARKYYLERVQGWTEKIQGAAKFFGIAMEQGGIQFLHQHRMDVTTALAEFTKLWMEHKDIQYSYNKTDKNWETLFANGLELIRLYAIKYPTMPYVVKNPRDFQVNSNFEVFPGSKLAGIEFTYYLDMLAEDRETGEPMVIDIKTSGKPVPEFTVLDPQLRSYAWIKMLEKMPNYNGLVAFLWIRKMGRKIDRGDTVTLLETAQMMAAGTEMIVIDKDDFGLFCTQDPKVIEEMDQRFVGESKAVKAERRAFVEKVGVHVLEKNITKQRIEFKSARITPESQEDIGRSIKRDIINIAAATEKDFFPMQSGVRYPNEKCPKCPMRGICSNRSDIRDALVVRKQTEEKDFFTADED